MIMPAPHRLRQKRIWQRGAAAVEAALVLPVAVFMIFACVEVYQYFRAAALLDRIAFTVANGVAMQRGLASNGQCDQSDDICVYGTMAQDLFQPLDYSKRGGMIISTYAATEPDKNGDVSWKAQPEWRVTFKGSTSSLPDPISKLGDTTVFPPARTGDTLIIAETFYDHEPFAVSSHFWTALAGTTSMYSRFFFRPRFNDLRTLL